MTLKAIIDALLASGLTEKSLADAVGTTQPTINRIRSGRIADPKDSLGSALRRLHGERCPRRAA